MPEESSDTHTKLYQHFDCSPASLSFIDAQRRRWAFRNARSLYQRTCDATGAPIISIYSPEKPLKVFSRDYWFGDAWNPLDYGRDIDFSRPFFEQFAELDAQVPRLALFNFDAENSDYCNSTWGNKNCYLVFGGDFNEDCLYGTYGMHNRDSLDIDFSNENEQCYELGDSLKCFGCSFTLDSKNCSSCYFVSDCIGCTECILSTNLVNKQYCIENVQYSKEEYFAKKKELIDGRGSTQRQLLKRFLELRAKRPVKFTHTVDCEDCSGDYLKNSRNCYNSYDVSDCENLTNVVFASKSKDAADCGPLGDGAELVLNAAGIIDSYDVMGSWMASHCRNIRYSKYSISSKDLFGCSGLRSKQYCILNKQYTEQEYKALTARLIQHMKQTGEWGQFLPQSLSDFAFNETSAYAYFPLSKEEALAQGYTWRDETAATPVPASYTVPDNIADVTEEVLQGILVCARCGKNYKIMPQELAFYKQTNTPIPDQCEGCRHKRRAEMRNPKQLFDRTCAGCNVPVNSTYAPDRTEKVLCEACYLKEVH